MTWAQQPYVPPRRNTTLRTVLIILGVVLVLCCTGAGFAGYTLFRNVQAATGPVRDAADTFITNLETGNVQSAHEQLCAETKGRFPLSEFTTGMQTQPKVRSHRINGVFVNTSNGVQTGTVNASLTLDTGFVDEHVFRLVPEDGWKVCGQPY